MKKYEDLNFPNVSLEDWATKLKKDLKKEDPLDYLTTFADEGILYPALGEKNSSDITLETFPDTCEYLPANDKKNALIYNPVKIWDTHNKSLSTIISEEPNCDEVKISMDILHNAGSSVCDELALGLSLAMNFAEKKIIFVTSVSSKHYLSMAKIRALRYLWEQFCKQNSFPFNFQIQAQSSLREQTLYDNWNNEIRNTLSAAAGIWAGADTLTLFPHDELFHQFNEIEDNENSMRLCENVFHILMQESHLPAVKDPAKGSFAIENLTNSIITNVHKILSENEKDDYNSFWASLEKKVFKSYQDRSKKYQTLSQAITGINNYSSPDQKYLINDQNAKFYSEIRGKFPLRRDAEEFENLRIGFEKISLELSGVILCSGDRKKLTPRINFCKNIFEIAGIKMTEKFIEEDDFSTEVATSQVVVLCAEDDNYHELINESHDIGKFTTNIYIAGNFAHKVFEGTPIRSTVYRGQNIYELLKRLLEEILA